MNRKKLRWRSIFTSRVFVLTIFLGCMTLLTACSSSSTAHIPATPTLTASTPTLSPIASGTPVLDMGLGWKTLLFAQNTSTGSPGTSLKTTLGHIPGTKVLMIMGWCHGVGKMHVEVVSQGTLEVPCSTNSQPIVDQIMHQKTPAQGTQYEVVQDVEGSTTWEVKIQSPSNNQ